MSNEVAIRVENLSKAYRIGMAEQRHETLMGAMVSFVKSPLENYRNLRKLSRFQDVAKGEERRAEGEAQRGKGNPASSSASSVLPAPCASPSDVIWALKNVSFEVKQGEVLGLIGRNGAGKSTLLKLLSRITEPTSGRAQIYGRVASLLEVGTGFHPDLTGRENIYLNGTILGMKKREVDGKFSEIVAFSEVEKFIDTPVKRYSSGMRVRLGFAVAAHLEPEILIVDEVLAVGDVQFQLKCLGKMNDIATGGRTVLFVSHNMVAIANLCSRCVLLSQGQIQHDGPSDVVIDHYIQAGRELQGEIVWNNRLEAPGNTKVRLHAVRIVCEGQTTGDISIDKECRILMDYWNLAPGLPISASIHLLDKSGCPVLATANMHSTNLLRDEWFGKPFPPGLYRSVCTVPANLLNEGTYSVRAALCSNVGTIELLTEAVVSFRVHDRRREFAGHWIGVVRPKLAWHTQVLGPLK